MAENTSISWTDATFNPVWGCTKVSPGCDNCYAEKQANRFGKWWDGNERREFGDKHWNDPVRWNRAAEKAGTRTKVFCSSMSDVFDKDWPDGIRERLWGLIKATPCLDWIIVTKRIGNAQKMLPADWGDGYPNVWLLITVVTLHEAERDVPKLLYTPARVRGLSIEPQLGVINLTALYVGGKTTIDALRGKVHIGDFSQNIPAIDWVICGAESGPRRRPFNICWARSLREQCKGANVAFFLKQMPGGTGLKGVVETPELDGQQWTQFPGGGA